VPLAEDAWKEMLYAKALSVIVQQKSKLVTYDTNG